MVKCTNAVACFKAAVAQAQVFISGLDRFFKLCRHFLWVYEAVFDSTLSQIIEVHINNNMIKWQCANK